MKRFPLSMMAVALVLFVSGCLNADGDEPQAQQPPAAEQPGGQTGGQNGGQTGGNANYDAAAAEATFRTNCASCHGQTLEGAVGPNLQHVGSKYTREQIGEILANGKGAMPGGLVKGEDAANIAAWLADKK